MKNVLVLAIAGVLTTSSAHAQTPYRFDLDGYVSNVLDGNLDMLAQKSTVPFARAQVDVAKSSFPDPLLTGGLLQYDVTQQGNPSATTLALFVPLQIAGQRGSRMDVASAGARAVTAELDDFGRGLRAEAANAYIDGLHARLVLDRKKRTLESLEKLVAVNEQRNKSGDVGEVIVVQSRVEAHQSRAEVLAAEGEVKANDIRMIQLLGARAIPWTQSLALAGSLESTVEQKFVADELVARALERRPDVRAAKHRVEQAERQVSLARANRWFDIALGASWVHNFPTSAPTNFPASDFIGGTLTVPLPFTRIWRGELDAAHVAEDQSHVVQKAVGSRIEMEVRRAVVLYDAAAARAKMYTRGGVLTDADAVLDKTLFNYTRGGNTLVEVLVAQRTVNLVYLSYYDALADTAHAFVAVEQAAGSWNMSL